MPYSIRESQSLTAFKKELKASIVESDCKVCKMFISGLGFIKIIIFSI